MSINIQLYTSATDNIGKPADLRTIIDQIAGKVGASAQLQQKIDKIRELATFLKDSDHALETREKGNDGFKNYVDEFRKQYDELKKSLPAVTWSGTFTKRAAKSIKEYSQLICLDFDHVADLALIREKIISDEHTLLCFISPSGTGLKVLFKVPGSVDQHKEYFIAIEKYFLETYSLAIDKSGKDVSRLCFLSYDESIYYNNVCSSFHLPVVIQEKKLSKAQESQLSNTDEDLYSVIHFTDKIATYSDGNRNNYIHLFACNANRKGFSLDECLGFSTGHFSDMAQREIETTVKSAYQHNSSEHGKFKKGAGSSKGSKKNVSGTQQGSAASRDNNESDNSEQHFKFWKEHKVKKGRGDNAYEIVNLILNRVDFSDFLYKQGFHLLQTGKDGYQICHSDTGIIKPVDPHHVKQHVLRWCKKNELPQVEEMLRKGQKQYFAFNELDSLPYKDVVFKRDTEKESYFYFNNCWVTVTAEKITTHQYSELKEFIWHGNKIPHDFKLEEISLLNKDTSHIDPAVMNCEFAKFIYLFSYNPNNYDEKNFEPDTINQRFFCTATSFGYLLDSYKHPANRKGIFAIDHKIGEKGEQHGRTGKSIIPKAAGYFKVTSTINGKSFDPKYQFKFEPITMDSQIVNFNDMPRNFDVEALFEVIADDYSVIRRNNGFVHFRYQDSPKVYASTNFTPNGDGASYRGRMHVIEASDYFSDTHSPYDEFGHSLFTDWNIEEWNRFFNMGLMCVQFFKTDGLVNYPKSNFDTRKLVNEVAAEFIDFMDNPEYVARNKRIEKIPLLEEFNKIYLGLYSKKLLPHSFHKWVKGYCKTKGLRFNPHRSGGHDKSNSKEFYLIADDKWKPEQQNLL